MIKMIAANRETVTVTAEKENMQIGTGQTDGGCQRNCPSMDEMCAVRIDEIGKARGAADTRKRNNILVGQLPLLQHLIK
jgi:hypothetical protein